MAGPDIAAINQLMLFHETALTSDLVGTNCARNELNAGPLYALIIPVPNMSRYIPHCTKCREEIFTIQSEVITSSPSISNKYRNMQMLISRCLLLLSTFTPAGKARAIAGTTSDKPKM